MAQHLVKFWLASPLMLGLQNLLRCTFPPLPHLPNSLGLFFFQIENKPMKRTRGILYVRNVVSSFFFFWEAVCQLIKSVSHLYQELSQTGRYKTEKIGFIIQDNLSKTHSHDNFCTMNNLACFSLHILTAAHLVLHCLLCRADDTKSFQYLSR